MRPLTPTPKIEADLLLLVEHANGPHLYVAEVKAMANTPWYGTIELLRQLRLLLSQEPGPWIFPSHRGDPVRCFRDGSCVGAAGLLR
jgi:hypothetical protein